MGSGCVLFRFIFFILFCGFIVYCYGFLNIFVGMVRDDSFGIWYFFGVCCFFRLV